MSLRVVSFGGGIHSTPVRAHPYYRDPRLAARAPHAPPSPPGPAPGRAQPRDLTLRQRVAS